MLLIGIATGFVQRQRRPMLDATEVPTICMLPTSDSKLLYPEPLGWILMHWDKRDSGHVAPPDCVAYRQAELG